MRILLNRERNNIFVIPDSYLYKNKVRIMGIYENDTLINPADFQFMGPRRVKLLKDINKSSNVYAKVMEIKTGNKIIGR